MRIGHVFKKDGSKSTGTKQNDKEFRGLNSKPSRRVCETLPASHSTVRWDDLEWGEGVEDNTTERNG